MTILQAHLAILFLCAVVVGCVLFVWCQARRATPVPGHGFRLTVHSRRKAIEAVSAAWPDELGYLEAMSRIAVDAITTDAVPPRR